MAKKLDLAELNKRYQEGESCDSELFSEQRSNVLLVAGEHYTKLGSKFWNKVRDNRQINPDQKLRLTKNHTQKITKLYKNNITSHAPWVSPVPKNDNELQDRKAAELNKAVWEDMRDRQKLKKKVREWVGDYIDIGECFVKVYFDPNAGEIRGYEQEINAETGEPEFDEMGQPVKGKPLFTGEIKFERYYAFNAMRAPSAKSMDDSPYIILRKMSAISDLMAIVGEDEDKKKALQESSKDTFIVFSGTNGEYTKSKDEILVCEQYIKPCLDYPNGYFYIHTPHGILFEGELPSGIFPVLYVGFDEHATTPRARSIIKVIRPYQAEVNRSASKIAEHQVTLGDDKIVFSAGSKVTHGGQLPGVRGIAVSGPPPAVIPGRSGEQYLGYMNSQIDEMYGVANLREDAEEVKAGVEPMAQLWSAIRDKKKFSIYGEKFEDFLKEICETALAYAKFYYDDSHLVPAIGRREYINIAEFKSQEKLCYQIKVEARGDDVETQMGKQLQLNTILQYAGKTMDKSDIGRMLRSMPFMNGEEAFGDLTLDYDNATNVILALDRGEAVSANESDNHPYMIKKLVHRMRQGDFRLLDPLIQANYVRLKSEHEAIEAFLQDKIQNAKSGYIPTGGYMVTCDFYVNDPMDPSKTKRAKLPYESMEWLLKRLEEQGSSLERLEGMQSSMLAGIAGQMGAGMGQMAPPMLPQDRGGMGAMGPQ